VTAWLVGHDLKGNRRTREADVPHGTVGGGGVKDHTEVGGEKKNIISQTGGVPKDERAFEINADNLHQRVTDLEKGVGGHRKRMFPRKSYQIQPLRIGGSVVWKKRPSAKDQCLAERKKVTLEVAGMRTIFGDTSC